MNQAFKYRKKILAASISAITATSIPAQDVLENQYDPSQIDEVVVTGIRASLQRSMDIKRDSKGVVDGISAEDIGKFPEDQQREFSLKVFPFSFGLFKLKSDVEKILIFFGNKALISLNLPLLLVPINSCEIFFGFIWKLMFYLPYKWLWKKKTIIPLN